MTNKQKLFPIMDYARDKMLLNLPESTIYSILLDILTYDRSLCYELVARYVQLEMDQLLHLIRSHILELKQVAPMISEAGENQIERLTNAVRKRGEELLAEGKYLEAADAGFAILLAVEPELLHVRGEGIVLQVILDETFLFLEDIVQRKYSAETAAALRVNASTYYSSRKNNENFYEDQWLDLLKQFG